MALSKERSSSALAKERSETLHRQHVMKVKLELRVPRRFSRERRPSDED